MSLRNEPQTAEQLPAPRPPLGRPLAVVADPISAAGLARLAEVFDVDASVSQNSEDLFRRCAEADALIIRSATRVDARLISASGCLTVIGRAGVGLDNVDLEAAQRAGITVVNTPDANSVSAAEHAMALLLAVARHVPQARQSMQDGRWDRTAFVGVELSGKTLAILGLGRVGRLVAERANAFGMRIVGYDPYLPGTTGIPAHIRRVDSVAAATAAADFVTVHMPLTAETRNLIDTATISKMPHGVRIVNAARGGIVNEGALLDALDAGRCAGAGLDVFVEEPVTDRRLVDHPLVVATPHIGASTTDAQNRAGLQVADAVISAFSSRFQSIA